MMVLLQNAMEDKEISDAHDVVDIEDFVEYIPDFLDTKGVLFAGLQAEMQELKGSQVKASKNNKPGTTWFGKVPYNYTGKKHEAQSLENFPCIQEYFTVLDADTRCGKGDSAHISYYSSGSVFLSLHSDDEEVLDQSQPISILSIGADRQIDFFSKHATGRHAAVKSIVLKEGSLCIMKPGCQSRFRHRIPASNIMVGERFSISRRQVISEAPADKSPVSQSQHPRAEMDKKIAQNKLPCASVIIGTSIEVPLKAEKLGKGRHKCFNLSGGGFKIWQGSQALDDFYSEHGGNYDVRNVFVSLGINDIRYSRHGVLFLRRVLVNLIHKIKRYFPSCNIYMQSVLPVYIDNEYTVKNINDYNKLLFLLCAQEKCYYIDAFRYFLDQNGQYRNQNLYKDKVHLNHYGVGLLARNYIYLINNKRFNPIGF